MAEKCSVHASISTIHYFVRRRSKAKRNTKERQSWAAGAGAEGRNKARTEEKAILKPEMKPTEDAVYQRIAALKQRRAPIPNMPTLFHYDPDKPLQLPKTPEPPKAGK